MEIRTVKDDKFQDIEQYINRLVQYVESLEDLTFVTTKNAKYMVCKLDKTTPNVFALIKNDGKELKDYLVQLDEKGNIVHFTGGRTEYNINNEGLERIVQKVDIDTLTNLRYDRGNIVFSNGKKDKVITLTNQASPEKIYAVVKKEIENLRETK